MFRKIKDLDFTEFANMIDEISKEFAKEISEQFEKENSQPSIMDNVGYNLYEHDEYAYLEIPLPGFDKSEITSELKNSILTIKANKKLKSNREYIVHNYNIGDLEFSIPLRKDIAGGIWKAELKNGILKYTIEKQKKKDTSIYINII